VLEREATAWRDLRLDPPSQPAPPTPLPEPRAADRIKDALLRWLEEEM
jgi:hypothetical protein